jgi:hypothetical protein
MQLRTALALTALAGLTAGTANAAILAADDFDHTDGNLVGNIPDVGAAWANHSGSGDFIQVTGGDIDIVHGSGSREDANITFANTTSGTLFYSFDFSVSAASGASFDEYFAHFKDGGTDFTSRMHVEAGTTGDYTVGISGSSGSPDSVWATDLTFGTTYRVVVGFDFGTGVSTLWIDASSSGDTSIVSAADTVPAIEAIAFRQASSDETITVDNLFVATTFEEANTGVPEPGSLALLALGGLMIARRRRG